MKVSLRSRCHFHSPNLIQWEHPACFVSICIHSGNHFTRRSNNEHHCEVYESICTTFCLFLGSDWIKLDFLFFCRLGIKYQGFYYKENIQGNPVVSRCNNWIITMRWWDSLKNRLQPVTENQNQIRSRGYNHCMSFILFLTFLLTKWKTVVLMKLKCTSSVEGFPLELF